MIPKFRAWHKKHKIMMIVQEIKWNEKGKIYWIAGDKFFETKGSQHLEVDNIILMQSTGLKDKNGKEIFEGDIVRFHYEGFTTSIEDISSAYMYYYQEDPHDFKECEVIGNVHEHPELLEAEK